MPGPFRRWRTLIAVAGLWVVACWYLYSDGSLLEGVPQAPKEEPLPPARFQPPPVSPPRSKGDTSKVRWSKLPDRYPVTSFRPLPTGRPQTPIPKIQKTPPPKEDGQARRTRLARQAAVKESFLRSWEGYKAHAWLQDEVAPLSGRAKNTFGGWAATLVDALDTLWIMGLREDFAAAVKACQQIDFAYTDTNSVNVFETTIRYLGGLLAAYEISNKKFPTLLDKAVEVAELLMCAFDTPNRMPISRWDWQGYVNGKGQTAQRQVLVSEIGSLSLEFTKLSQLTGDLKYYDAVQRISDVFEEGQMKTKLPGMWPVVVDAATPAFHRDSAFTLGGMSDSLYEYFPKQYLILGGALEQPRKLYEGFIDVAKKHLFRRAINEENIPIVISGDVRVRERDGIAEVVTTPKGQHLTCFTGGMVGIGAKIFDRPEDLDVAVQLTDGCVWSYNATASGIGPEIFSFASCGGIGESQTGEKCKYTVEKWRDAVGAYWGFGGPAAPGSDLGGGDDQISSAIKTHRLPPGMVEVNDRKYILRPEAIESVFMMWRLTGDAAWQDKAWAMFEAVEAHTRSDIAAASLDDVTRANPTQVDSMESFWLAETLKYFYLVFADWDVVDLDEWVLNTEAHPMRRPDV